MKRIFRVIKITLFVVVIAIVSLVIIAWAMQERISKLAIEMLSDAIEAPLGVEDVTFSLIRDFPLATIQFKGLWLGAPKTGHDTAASTRPIDTLARFDRLFISVESRPLLDNIFNISEVEVKGGHLKYSVNEQGLTCLDFLFKADTVVSSADGDTASVATIVKLHKLTLRSLTCHYDDARYNVHAKASVEDVEAALAIDSVTVFGSADGRIKLTALRYGENLVQEADLQFDVAYGSDTVSIKALNINVLGASVAATGKLIVKEDVATDLSVSASNLNVSAISQYVPVAYLNQYAIGKLAGIVNLEANIKGKLSAEEMPHYQAKFSLAGGRVQWSDYPEMNDIEIRATATNGNLRSKATTAINIAALHLTANGNRLDLEGSIHNLDQIHYRLKSSIGLDLAKSRSLIPDTLVQNVNGTVNAYVETNGVLPASMDLRFADYVLKKSSATLLLKDVNIDVDSTVSLQNISAQLKYSNGQLKIDNFNIHIPQYEIDVVDNALSATLDGELSNAESLQLKISLDRLLTAGCSVSGNIFIKNFQHPVFAIHSNVAVDLLEAKRFLPVDVIKNVSGRVSANIHSEGTFALDSLAEQMDDLLYYHSTFDISLDDVSVGMHDTLINVQNLTGRVNVNPQWITVQRLRGKYSNIDFAIDTMVVKDLFGTVVAGNPGKLEVAGVWRVGTLEYSKLAPLMGLDKDASSATANKSEVKVEAKGEETKKEPWNGEYEIKGKLFVHSIKYKNALVEDISSLLNIKKTTYTLDDFRFKAFGGSMNSSVKIAVLPNNRVELDMKNQIERMNIRKMLHDLNNFDQTELTDKNINGIISTHELSTRIVMIGDSIVLPEMKMSGDLTLEKGGLFNYPPVQALASSIPGVKSLDTLELKTVNSHIFILQNAVYVPRTYLVSNAFDISAIGMQSFGDDYQYHLQVQLGEILLGKSKKRLQRQEAMGDVVTESNRRSLFVRSYSLNGKDRSGLDNKDDRQRTENKVRAQEKLLNLIFHPKLVQFDTGVAGKFSQE